MTCHDLPKASYDPIHPEKSSHSKLNWNNKLKKILNFSSFNSIIKILEWNTGSIIILVVE